MRPVIALLSDFGTRDHYVGTMKGVIIGICPDGHNNLWLGTRGGGVNILNTVTGTFNYLQPGESKQVNFNITTNDLKFYNSNLKYDWEGGEFIIYIGPNSRDLKSATVNWSR